jgi:hypothetical protein
MMYHIFLFIFSLLFLNIFLSSNIFYNIKKCCTMHIFKHFKCFTIQIFSKFKYDVLHIFSLLFLNIYLSSNIFHNIKKYDVPCIYLNISSVSQFKYFLNLNMMYHIYIYIYILSPISKFRQNITFFDIFSLSYLNLELINPLNTP